MVYKCPNNSKTFSSWDVRTQSKSYVCSEGCDVYVNVENRKIKLKLKEQYQYEGHSCCSAIFCRTIATKTMVAVKTLWVLGLRLPHMFWLLYFRIFRLAHPPQVCGQFTIKLQWRLHYTFITCYKTDSFSPTRTTDPTSVYLLSDAYCFDM